MANRLKSSAGSTPTETWRLPTALVRPWLLAAHLGESLRLPKGTVLYRQGEISPHFYLVLSGRIRVSMLREDGSEFLLEFMGRGAITREGAAFDGLPGFSSAVVAEAAQFVRFDTRTLSGAFREQPDLALSLLRITALKQRILAGRAQSLTVHYPEARITEVLLRLSRLYPKPNPGGVLIETHLTHQQLAAMTGVSRVTVTRVLRRLRVAGAIEVVDGLIAIRHPERLHF